MDNVQQFQPQPNSVVDVAVINTNIGYIQKDIAEIKQSIKDLSSIYATQLAVEEIKKDVASLRNSNNLWKWLSPTLSSALSAALTFLVLNFLGHIR